MALLSTLILFETLAKPCLGGAAPWELGSRWKTGSLAHHPSANNAAAWKLPHLEPITGTARLKHLYFENGQVATNPALSSSVVVSAAKTEEVLRFEEANATLAEKAADFKKWEDICRALRAGRWALVPPAILQIYQNNNYDAIFWVPLAWLTTTALDKLVYDPKKQETIEAKKDYDEKKAAMVAAALVASGVKPEEEMPEWTPKKKALMELSPDITGISWLDLFGLFVSSGITLAVRRFTHRTFATYQAPLLAVQAQPNLLSS